MVLQQIILGIANKVDDPLSTINTSLSDINSFANSTIDKLPDFLQHISPEQQQYLAALLKQARESRVRLSDVEKKQSIGKIVDKLNILQVDNAANIADIFIKLGCNEEIEPFLPMLTGKNYQAILENAYTIHTLHQNLKNIADSTTQFRKIFSALEDYSGDRESETKRYANIKSTIEASLKSYRVHPYPDIKIVKNFHPTSPTYCYPEKLQKAWINIINNAIEAMKGKGTLTIDLHQQDNNIVVNITDTGTGIESESLRQICDPFFTTKSAAGHVGLGLSIVKKIVDLHEGSIAAKSIPGKTIFTVSFPLVQQQLSGHN